MTVLRLPRRAAHGKLDLVLQVLGGQGGDASGAVWLTGAEGEWGSEYRSHCRVYMGTIL